MIEDGIHREYNRGLANDALPSDMQAQNLLLSFAGWMHIWYAMLEPGERMGADFDLQLATQRTRRITQSFSTY